MAIENIVKTKFSVDDRITKRFGMMQKAAARFGFGADKSFRKASRSAGRFSSITKGIVAGLGITKGISLVTQGLGSITTGFIAFEKAARGATVRFKDIGPDAADFAQQMRTVRDSAREAGATTEFTATQAAEALDFLARAGFNSAEAMGALGGMINLATASGEEFARVADISSDLLGAFGLNTDDTTQKIKNLNRVNDVLVKTANSANVTIEDMFETMKVAAPIGKQLGIEIEEIAALTAVMGNSGIKGSVAATALKNAFLRLSTGGSAVTKTLQGIGVEVDDGTGNMRKFTDILADVGQEIKGLGTLEQSKVLDALFGKRAIAGASNLIDNIGQLREFEKTLKSAGGTAEKTAAIMRQSLDAKLKTLISTVTELGFKFLEAFEVKGKKGIEAITEAIRKFDVKPVIAFFEKVASGIAFIWEWRAAIMSIVGVFFVFKILIGLLTAISIIASANPFGLIVIGIAAAVAGITALIVWLDSLVEKFNILGKIKSFFGFADETPAAPAPPPTPTDTRNMAGVENARDAADINRTLNINQKSTIEQPTGASGGLVRLGSSDTEPNDDRGGDKSRPPAPNAAVAEARSTNTFRGRLDIAGAPPGSKVSTTGGNADKFDVSLLGASQ